ncbi:hypothetical protein FQN50_003320 [Emmonsiellopsis sp. PD_5]|nr:hypothetical protein FQN50_003320 [Emmonsiellopsis sp. PD_5]
MISRISRLLTTILTLTLLRSTPTASHRLSHRQTDDPIRTIYQFPQDGHVENIAVRANGNLLVTYVTQPELYEIDPFTPTARANLIHTFPENHGVYGIEEIGEDVFAVATQIYDYMTGQPVVGSGTVWRVDMGAEGETGEIATIPEAQFPNGLTGLRSGGASAAAASAALVSDSLVGCVWKVDLLGSGVVEKILDLESMHMGDMPPGINGILVQGNMLYYTNMGTGVFYSLPLKEDGSADGEPTVIAEGIQGDDFDIDGDGNVYIAANTENTLYKISAAGEVSVASIDVLLGGLTSAHFGRTEADSRILYVATAQGRVVAVDVDLL